MTRVFVLVRIVGTMRELATRFPSYRGRSQGPSCHTTATSERHTVRHGGGTRYNNGAVGAARRREPLPEQGLHGTMTRHRAASLMTTSRLSIASRGITGAGVTACDHGNLLHAARECASAISPIDARTTIALEDGLCT